MGSSAVFLFGRESLGIMLANSGYDVWLLNIRGNVYSRQHKSLKPCSTCQDFWSFSFEESAIYDYPAVIDYVLEYISQPSLSFVGYSLGTTQYLILLSELPEYNDRIKVGYLMGPAAYMGNASNPVIGLKRPFLRGYHKTGLKEIYPSYMTLLSRGLCFSGPLGAWVCQKVWNTFATSDAQELDFDTTLMHLSHMPAGASIKTFMHYLQLFESGRFAKFDYGPGTNAKIYGSLEAPQYNLSRVTAPTVLYCGDGDDYTPLQDTQRLANELPNLRANHVINRPGWNHLDFAYSEQTGMLVYREIIHDLNKIHKQN